MTPTFDGLTCKIGNDLVLKIDQTIDYKSAIDHRTSIGKIKEFSYAPDAQSSVLGAKDKSSLWMYVEESETGEKEWISVNVWYQHMKAGIFNNIKYKENDSKGTKDTEDLPF